MLGQQEEISHSILSQEDPLNTNEDEDSKNIYENTTQISNDNNTNELLENMTTAEEANKARMKMMILRSKEDLKEPSRFKDFVKEWEKRQITMISLARQWLSSVKIKDLLIKTWNNKKKCEPPN